MRLGEKAKLEARRDTVLLALFPGPHSPQDATVFSKLREKVDVKVDPVRAVPLIERDPTPVLQFVATGSEASGAVAKPRPLVDVDERGRHFLSGRRRRTEERAQQERCHAETASILGLFAHTRNTSLQRIRTVASTDCGRIMWATIACIPLPRSYPS